MPNNRTKDATATLVDGHVHIHEQFELGAVLDAALKNFKEAARGLGLDWPCRMLLMLTETAAADQFGSIKSTGGNDNTGNKFGAWAFEPTAESCSLRLRLSTGEEIFVIAGRQILTAERLEVLALGSDVVYPDGEIIETCIERIRATGAVVVLPWGFGKWWGRRGHIIRRLLDQGGATSFYLGDNSGRPKFLPSPSEFSSATARGMHILPGTDPLPFPEEASRVGRFGFCLHAAVSTEMPAADLKRMLSDQETKPIAYGRGEGLLRFIRNQMAMQFVKRSGFARRSSARPADSSD